MRNKNNPKIGDVIQLNNTGGTTGNVTPKLNVNYTIIDWHKDNNMFGHTNWGQLQDEKGNKFSYVLGGNYVVYWEYIKQIDNEEEYY